MITIVSSCPSDTFNIGRKIGQKLEGGEIILLSGDLGAGKTMVVKGIADGLGVDQSSPVVSPTFTLVNLYRAKFELVHVDLYRVDSEGVSSLGIEEYMDKEHVIMVEWADVCGGYFKGQLLDIKIEYTAEYERKIIIEGEILKEGFWR